MHYIIDLLPSIPLSLVFGGCLMPPLAERGGKNDVITLVVVEE